MDFFIPNNQNLPRGQMKKNIKKPIGVSTTEYVGTVEEIKKKICDDVDLAYKTCRKLYDGGE